MKISDLLKKKKVRNICNPDLVEKVIKETCAERKTIIEDLKEPAKVYEWFETTYRRFILREGDNYCWVVSNDLFDFLKTVVDGVEQITPEFFTRWVENDDESKIEPRPIMSLDQAKKQNLLPTMKSWLNKALNQNELVHIFVGPQEVHDNIIHILDWVHDDKVTGNELIKMSVLQVVEKIKNWMERKQKEAEKAKYAEEEKKEAETSVELWKSKDGEFRIVELMSYEGYAREGRRLHHCIAQYWTRRSYQRIFSLRNEENDPILTIEVERSNGKIVQMLGLSNRQPTSKEKEMVTKAITEALTPKPKLKPCPKCGEVVCTCLAGWKSFIHL